jgi:uncharacterized protein
MIARSRRSFLKASTAAAGLCLIRSLAPAEALGADAPSDASARLMPFPLASVRLAPGIFKEQEEINARYLDSLAVDRLLHSASGSTAGISSSATPYKGWEDRPANCAAISPGGTFCQQLPWLRPPPETKILRSEKAMSWLTALPMPEEDRNRLSERLSHRTYSNTWCRASRSGRPSTPITKSWPACLICTFWPATPMRFRLRKAWRNGRRRILLGHQRRAASAHVAHRVRRHERGARQPCGGDQKDRYLETAHLFEQPGFLDPLAARRDELQGLHAIHMFRRSSAPLACTKSPATAATGKLPSTSSKKC